MSLLSLLLPYGWIRLIFALAWALLFIHIKAHLSLVQFLHDSLNLYQSSSNHAFKPRVCASRLKEIWRWKKTLPLPRFKLTTYWLTCNLYHNDHLPITFCSRPSWPLKDCRFSVGPCCGLQQADPAMARPFPEPMRHIRLLFTSVNFWVILAGQGLNQASLNLMEKFHSVWLHFELSLCAPASISLVNLFLL